MVKTLSKRPWYDAKLTNKTKQNSTGVKVARPGMEAGHQPEGDQPANPDVSEERLTRLESEVKIWRHEVIELKGVIDARNLANNMAMARDREELDFLHNKNKENRIIVTGLSSNTPTPSDSDEKMEWIKTVIRKLFGMLDSGAESRIVGIYQKKGLGAYQNQGRGDLPAAEVVMSSGQAAFAIRSNFAAKKKEGIEFNDIFMTNVSTLATGVRTSILEAIAKICVKTNQAIFVRHYVTRPTLLIRSKQGDKINEIGLTFVDALKRYGKDLEQA